MRAIRRYAVILSRARKIRGRIMRGPYFTIMTLCTYETTLSPYVREYASGMNRPRARARSTSDWPKIQRAGARFLASRVEESPAHFAPDITLCWGLEITSERDAHSMNRSDRIRGWDRLVRSIR